MFTVYMHRTPSYKVYIGITSKSTISRWGRNGEGYSTQLYFWKAIKKYGWDNIEHIIVAENLSKEDACRKEKELIALYHSNNPEFGYNISEGGEGPFGVKRSEETKERIRQKAYKQFENGMPLETKKKISENSPHYNKGKVWTQEQKNKVSKANKGRVAWNKGKKMSDEQRKKLSQSHKGQIPWNKGKPGSEEMKAKVSKANKGKVPHNKGKKMSEEQKQKISNSVKLYWENKIK